MEIEKGRPTMEVIEKGIGIPSVSYSGKPL